MLLVGYCSILRSGPLAVLDGYFFSFLFFFFFLPQAVALRILAPQPGIEPMPPAVEVQSLNHWTTREVL